MDTGRICRHAVKTHNNYEPRILNQLTEFEGMKENKLIKTKIFLVA